MEKGVRERILEVLSQKRQVPQSELWRIAGVSKSRASEVLKELENEGLISKRRLLGRNVVVKLTNQLRIGIIRAAEYPFVIPFMRRLNANGYKTDLLVYDNGIEATRALVNGQVDLALSPFITQALFSAVAGIKILAGGAKGGGALVGGDFNAVGSTVMSSMDLWLHMEFGNVDVIPFSSGKEMAEAFLSRKVGAVAIWEPYVTLLERAGHRARRFDLLDCCTLSSRPDLDSDKLIRLYYESFNDFRSAMDRWAGVYAEAIGEEYSLISSALKNYEFDPTLDKRMLERQLRVLGIKLHLNV